MSIKIDISLCRVCLVQGPGTNIFTGNILEKFQYATLVQVEKNDGLSEIICKKCLVRLHIAYDFKKEATTSNRQLQSFLSNVNKQFQQVTGTGSSSNVSKSKKNPNTIAQQVVSESYDELEEDMQALIDDEQEVEFKDIDAESTDEIKKELERDQLVEILGDNNAISVRRTRSARLVALQEDSSEEPSENMEVFLVDESGEVESGYIVDEYEGDGELITDETETQYLEEEENDDQFYETEAGDSKSKSAIPKTRSAPGSNPENRCDKCGKTFSTRTNLTRHRITHEGRKPYICPICGGSFTQNGSLKSHMFIHTGERPFACTECGQAFTQSKSLVFHMRRHTGEKPFPCDFCGVKFRQKDGLKRHIIAKHSESRTKHHVCEVCGKILLSKYSMNMHLSRHSAKEIASAAKRHKKEKSKGKSSTSETKNEGIKLGVGETIDEWDDLFACEYCDQAFTTSNELLEHRETHPEINDEPKFIEESSLN